MEVVVFRREFVLFVHTVAIPESVAIPKSVPSAEYVATLISALHPFSVAIPEVLIASPGTVPLLGFLLLTSLIWMSLFWRIFELGCDVCSVK
jgi:hypothetical protein